MRYPSEAAKRQHGQTKGLLLCMLHMQPFCNTDTNVHINVYAVSLKYTRLYKVQRVCMQSYTDFMSYAKLCEVSEAHMRSYTMFM